MKRASRLGAAVAALVTIVAFAANAAAGASITTLVANAGVSNVTVSGKGAFTGSEVVVGTDAASDGRVPGSDILSASIAQDPAGKLTFKLALTDSPQPVPEVMFYNWQFNLVDAAGGATRYWLKAARTSYGSAQSEAPSFELWSNPDANGIYGTLTVVQGSFTTSSVTWVVDSAVVSANPGTTIQPQSGSSVSASGGVAAGAAGSSVGFTPLTFDSIATEEFEVLAPSVSLGIAPAGTAEDQVPLTVTAPVKANGSFTASLPKPAAGSYIVVARGCSEDVCATRSTPLTVQ